MRLEVCGLEQGYGRAAVLTDVSFGVSSGEIVTVLGPNGSGKSTLVKTICGILRPRAGGVFVDGEDARSMPRREFAKIAAYVPQSSETFGYASVYDSVLAGRRPYIDWDYGAEDVRIAADAMRTMGIDGFHAHNLGDLSGGQKQRAHIARALAQDSSFFVLDEPTSALDLHHQLGTMGIMRELCGSRGKGAVVALHDLNLAINYSDRVVVLYGGAVYDQGPPADVITEDMIEDVYGVSARIVEDGGRRFVHPYGDGGAARI